MAFWGSAERRRRVMSSPRGLFFFRKHQNIVYNNDFRGCWNAAALQIISSTHLVSFFQHGHIYIYDVRSTATDPEGFINGTALKSAMILLFIGADVLLRKKAKYSKVIPWGYLFFWLLLVIGNKL